MGLGAIVVPGMERGGTRGPECAHAAQNSPASLAYLNLLGRSPVERIVERFVRAEVDVVSVLCKPGEFSGVKPSFTAFENVEHYCVPDLSRGVEDKLREYSEKGIDHAFLLFGNLYAETDLLDFFYFHRESRRNATRSVIREEPLDLWAVRCCAAQDQDLSRLLANSELGANAYLIRDYVNQLAGFRDFRRFAADLLQGRCFVRPPGREVKRGIWIDDEAEVHRQARIVAPAYVGRRSRVLQDTLITRASSVEKDCCIDYGTVIEDTSVLQNTEIGICLDVCHAIANGSKLVSLDRDVVIEISDPAVMHSNTADRGSAKERRWARNVLLFGRKKQPRQAPVTLQPAASAPEPSRFEIHSLRGESDVQ